MVVYILPSCCYIKKLISLNLKLTFSFCQVAFAENPLWCLMMYFVRLRSFKQGLLGKKQNENFKDRYL